MKFITILLVLLFIPDLSLAQEPHPLSLDEAIEIMLVNNPAIAASTHHYEATRNERKAINGSRLPQLSFTGGYTYMSDNISIDANHLKQGFNDISSSFITSSVTAGFLSPQTASLLQELGSTVQNLDWSYTLQKRSTGFIGAEVSIPIFLGGKINAATRAASIKENIASQQIDEIKNSLISELVACYYGVIIAQRVVDVRRRVVAGIARHLSDTEALEQQGMIARSERLYVEYKMAEAKRELLDAELNLSTIRQALQNTLFTSADYEPNGVMFTLKSLEDVEYYKHQAISNNPALYQLSLQRNLAYEASRLQRAEFFPQVVAAGGATLYRYQLSSLLPRWMIGVNVNFKIFDGLGRERRYAASKQIIREVENITQKAQADIEVWVEEIYNTLLNYQNTITSLESSLNFAEEYLEAQRIAFTEGWCTAAELIDAELNLAKSQTERIEAAYSYDVALAKLLEISGLSHLFSTYAKSDNIRIIE